MLGKLSKVAQGRMQTHVGEGDVDFGFLAEMAAQLGAGPELVEHILSANTARHVQSMLRQAGVVDLEAQIACLAAEKASAFLEGALPALVLLFDIGGAFLASARVAAGWKEDA